MRTDFNASGRYFSMSVSLKKHVCTFMYLFSPCIFLSLVATRACTPKTHPQDKTAESLLITLTITQQLRRDLGPFPHCLSPSLMRKSSPASAGSLLPRFRQDTARQYIFIKAQAWSCSRELRFNVIYGESLPREIMEPPVYLAWSGRLGICQWARRGCCMNRNRNQPAHPPCSIYPSSEAPSCGISYRFSAPLTLLFNLYVILSYCCKYVYVGRCNSFLGVGAIPLSTCAFPSCSTNAPMQQMGRSLVTWCCYPHQLKSSSNYVCNIN